MSKDKDKPVQELVEKGKSWLKSKTIIAILITAIQNLVIFLKPEWVFDLEGAKDVVVETAEQAAPIIDSMYLMIGTLISLGVAAWGRMVAKFKIN